MAKIKAKKTITEIVAERLLALRKARSFSRMAVYEQCGVHWDVIRRIETDGRDVQLSELYALSELYGVDPLDVLSEDFTFKLG